MKIIKVLVIIFSALFIFMLIFHAVIIIRGIGKIGGDAYIQNIKVSGLTERQARNKLEDYMESRQSEKAYLVLDDISVEISLKDTIEKTDIAKKVGMAYSIYRKAGVGEKHLFFINRAKNKIDLKLDIVYKEEKIEKLLESVKNNFNKLPKSDIINRISIDEDGESYAYQMDVDTTKDRVKEYLAGHGNENKITVAIELLPQESTSNMGSFDFREQSNKPAFVIIK